MISLRKINPMARAVGTMGIVATLVGAVTYASVTSDPVVLADNTINTNATLQISNGGDYSNSVTGFTFSGAVPGGSLSDSHTFFVKNNGNVPLALNVNVPTLPSYTVVPFTSGPVNNSSVFPNISCTSGASGNFTLTAVSFGTLNSTTTAMTGSQLAAGDVATCSINIGMDGGAVTGSPSSITTTTGFAMDFTGTNGS